MYIYNLIIQILPNPVELSCFTYQFEVHFGWLRKSFTQDMKDFDNLRLKKSHLLKYKDIINRVHCEE